MIMMLNTRSAYTVIASASRANLPANLNITRHIDAGFSLSAMGYDRRVDVKGYYKEAGQLASEELSMALPVHSLQEVSQLATLFCGTFNQDCIMAINNKTKQTWLIDVEGHMIAMLGTWTAHATQPANAVGWTYDGHSYYTAE